MDAEKLKLGKEAFQHVVIDPLVKAGMERRANQKVAELDAMFDELRAKLAYLHFVPVSGRDGKTGLHVLAEIIARNAGGKERDRWPKQIQIERWAHQIGPAPESDSAMVRRWFQIYGDRAVQEDFAIEALAYLKTAGLFPNRGTFGWSKIHEKADRRRSEERAARRREVDGAATPSQRDLIERCDRARERITRIMNDLRSEVAA